MSATGGPEEGSGCRIVVFEIGRRRRAAALSVPGRCGRWSLVPRRDLCPASQEELGRGQGFVVLQVPHPPPHPDARRPWRDSTGVARAASSGACVRVPRWRRAVRHAMHRLSSRSFTVGNPPTATGSVPVAPTVTNVPGRYFTTRVARVTPSLIASSPSVPRLTSRGGIPEIERPFRANWRWRFIGSIPSRRPPGRWRVAGSIRRNSQSLIDLACRIRAEIDSRSPCR